MDLPATLTIDFRSRLAAFDASVASQIASGEIHCPVHGVLGQYEVPDALNRVLIDSDWLFSTHRNWGHYLAKGGDAEKLLAEMRGEVAGINGGFSGSMSFSDPAIRFHASAIVGGLIGVATGTAYAVKSKGEAVFCCIGDAATEQGVFWESLNFAALHALPIVYICENNGLSTNVTITERQRMPIAFRVRSFGINVDVLENLGENKFSIDRYNGNWLRQLPMFIEHKVTRACPHVEGHL